MFLLSDNLPLYPSLCLIVDGAEGWDQVGEVPFHVEDTPSRGHMFQGRYSYGHDISHCWESVFLWGETYDLLYISAFCAETPNVLRGHFSSFASHAGNFKPEASKVISDCFLIL